VLQQPLYEVDGRLMTEAKSCADYIDYFGFTVLGYLDRRTMYAACHLGSHATVDEVEVLRLE
jgi:hypothetical protein